MSDACALGNGRWCWRSLEAGPTTPFHKALVHYEEAIREDEAARTEAGIFGWTRERAEQSQAACDRRRLAERSLLVAMGLLCEPASPQPRAVESCDEPPARPALPPV